MFFIPEWMGDVCTRTWANMTMANSVFWKSVGHNGTIWVATGGNSTTNINYSSDGITWSSATGGSQLSDNYARARACWNGTTWAALAEYDLTPGHGMTSTDGQSWTNRDVPLIGGGIAKYLSVMGTKFVAATGNIPTNVFYTSTDGFTFSGAGGTLPYTTAWGASAYNGSTIVMLTTGNAGNDDRTAYSTNQGSTWVAGGALPVASTWSDVIWTGRIFFALDFNSSANAARSYDGITWTAVTMPAPFQIGNWGQPCFNNKGTIFIPMWYNTSFNAHTILYASVDDGDTWCLNTLSQSGQWGCAGSDGTRVVVCGNNISGAVDAKGSYADPS